VVAGLDTQLASILTLVRAAFDTPQRYAEVGLPPPRGVLLVGPPGTGKTLLARAVADRLGLPLHSVSSTDILSPVVGESEARLRALFRRLLRPRTGSAEAAAGNGALLFIDEIDGMCPPRGMSGGAEARLVASLLALLDGIDAKQTLLQEAVGVADTSGESAVGEEPHAPPRRLFVLAATNRAAAVDPALRRPGRFDREIEVGIPSAAHRVHILQACLDRYPHRLLPEGADAAASATPEDAAAQERLVVERVAARLHGYVGADIAALCKEAALNVLRRSQHGADPEADGGALCITTADLDAGIRSVQPSAIREVQVEVPRVHWQDIGGQEDTKQRLREAVEWPLTRPELFRALGIRAPKGILLYGPPGCSKTMMAKAMATEGHMNFVAVKGPELFSRYVGDSEKAVAEVFSKARAASPCIVFFDEFDSMAGSRSAGDGEGGSSVGTRVVSQLLQELDGIHSLRQVVVVAATNRPDLIDRALLRPGRIDRMLYVGSPDAPARHKIVDMQLARIPHSPDVDREELVRLLDGYSGAEIVGIFRDASVRAITTLSIDATGDQEAEAASLRRQHLVDAIAASPKQITEAMLKFYKKFTDV
jgi:AAA family ATPase